MIRDAQALDVVEQAPAQRHHEPLCERARQPCAEEVRNTRGQRDQQERCQWEDQRSRVAVDCRGDAAVHRLRDEGRPDRIADPEQQQDHDEHDVPLELRPREVDQQPAGSLCDVRRQGVGLVRTVSRRHTSTPMRVR